MAEGEDLEDPGDGPGAFVISVNSWFSEAFSLICLKLNFGLTPVIVPVGKSVERGVMGGRLPSVASLFVSFSGFCKPS